MVIVSPWSQRSCDNQDLNVPLRCFWVSQPPQQRAIGATKGCCISSLISEPREYLTLNSQHTSVSNSVFYFLSMFHSLLKRHSWEAWMEGIDSSCYLFLHISRSGARLLAWQLVFVNIVVCGWCSDASCVCFFKSHQMHQEIMAHSKQYHFSKSHLQRDYLQTCGFRSTQGMVQ